MGIRVQVGSDGSADNAVVSDTEQPQIREEKQAPAAEPVVKIGGQSSRYDVATGKLTYSAPTSAQVGSAQPDASSDPLDFALSPSGQVIGRHALTEDSIIDSPAIGGSMRLKEALALGWAKKTADGYVFLGVDGNFEPSKTVPKVDEQVEKPADAEPVSLEGVEGTSTSVDLMHRQLKSEAGPVVYQGLVSAYLSNSDPTSVVEDIARRSGQPASEVRAVADSVFAEYQTAAQQIAAANGVGNFPAFLEWAVKAAPDAAENALRELVEEHSAQSLGRLSKQYARLGRNDWTMDQILNASMGDGIRTFERDGKAWITIPKHGEMTFERAVSHGLIRLS
jgi:hypothetical protein